MSALCSAEASATTVRGKLESAFALPGDDAPAVQSKVLIKYPLPGNRIAGPRAPWVVVNIAGPAGEGAAAASPKVMSRGLLLEPPSLAVAAGHQVKFENVDRFPLTFDIAGTRLETLALGASASHTFDRAGLVDLRCVEWDHMKGRVLVLENALFAQPGDGGVFVIDNVSPGVKTARVFIEGQLAGKGDLQIPAEGEVAILVRVDDKGAASVEVQGTGLVAVPGDPRVAPRPEPAPEPKPKPEPKPEPKPKPKPRPEPEPDPAAEPAPPPPPPPPPPPESE